MRHRAVRRCAGRPCCLGRRTCWPGCSTPAAPTDHGPLQRLDLRHASTRRQAPADGRTACKFAAPPARARAGSPHRRRPSSGRSVSAICWHLRELFRLSYRPSCCQQVVLEARLAHQVAAKRPDGCPQRVRDACVNCSLLKDDPGSLTTGDFCQPFGAWHAAANQPALQLVASPPIPPGMVTVQRCDKHCGKTQRTRPRQEQAARSLLNPTNSGDARIRNSGQASSRKRLSDKRNADGRRRHSHSARQSYAPVAALVSSRCRALSKASGAGH